MTAFFQALEQGYTPEQVLGYISKALPQMSPMIRKAQRTGYPAQQIIGFLSKNFDTEDRRGMSESERHAANRRADSERTKYGLQLAGAAIATPLAARAAQGALARALPSSLTQGVGLLGSGNGNVAQPVHQQQTLQQQDLGTQPTDILSQSPSISSQPPVSPSIPNPSSPVQPEGISNISELIKKHGFEKQIESVSKNVKDPKGVAAILYNKFPKEMQKLQKEAGKPMEEVVAEYMQSNVKPLDTVESEPKAPMTREEALGKFRDNLIAKHSSIQPIQKGETVASPQGIGEIREIRNGKAIVEVNGKKHQINEDELEQEPEEIRSLDLEGPVAEYLSRIPEGEKSSVIDISLYDPETQELQVRFPNGDQWIYGPVPEEIFEKINSMTGIPVSSGESQLRGTIWEKGVAESAGADFYKLIKKFVREGKIKERKLKTGIDLFRGFTSVKKRK